MVINVGLLVIERGEAGGGNVKIAFQLKFEYSGDIENKRYLNDA